MKYTIKEYMVGEGSFVNRDAFTLYGLSEHENVISKMIEDLKCHAHQFDLKLILVEGINNAFKHGNNMDEEKPIYLKYEYIKETKYIKIEIEDSGSDLKDVKFVSEITDEMLEDTSGRGLYLIKCMSDAVYFKENKMVIEKCLN